MKSKNGSILILSLIVAGTVGLVAGTFLRSLLTEGQLEDLDFFKASALSLIDAGGETAVLALNYDDWEGWQISGSEAVRELSPIDIGNGQIAQVTVKIEDIENEPSIISEAKIDLKSGVTVRRQVKYDLRPRSLFGNAVTAGTWVYYYRGNRYNNTVKIDSYDSERGPYDDFLNRNDAGNVASEAMYNYHRTNAEIYGYASTNSGRGRRSPPSVGRRGRIYGIQTPSWVKIDEDRLSRDFRASFPEVTPPVIPTSTRLPTTTIIDLGNGATREQYRIAGDLRVNSDQTLRINGDVLLVVEDDFYIYGKVEIREPYGSLVVYIKDDFRIYSQGIVNYTKDPKKLIIYSTAPRKNRAYYYIMGIPDLYASIYAPLAYIDLRGDGTQGTLFGAIVADRVVFRGDFQLHYDEQLKTYAGETPSFTVAQSRLLDPQEMVTLLP